MSIPEDVYLPTFEELEVQEVNVSGSVLKGAAVFLGKSCEDVNNEFVLCRKEYPDARYCIEEGKAVTACTVKFFQAIKKSCSGEFMQYVNCLDKSSPNGNFAPCRKTQAVLDKCMEDNIGIARPPFDYFARVQVHKARKPKPAIEPKAEYPDRTPYLPEGTEMPPAKYGSRFHWMW